MLRSRKIMVRISIQSDECRAMLQSLSREKMPSAISNALNDTAMGLKAFLIEMMQRKIHNPMPSTLRGIFVKKATRQEFTASAHYYQAYRNADEYMMPLIEGGGRAKKPSEQRLGNFTIPASRANPNIMNAYGNIKGGLVSQMLSKLDEDAPVSNNRRRRGAAQKEYIKIKNANGKLHAGVYMRFITSSGFTRNTTRNMPQGRTFQRGRTRGNYSSVVRARGLLPFVLFVNQPVYPDFLPFFEQGAEYVNTNFPLNFERVTNFYIHHGFGR